MIYKFRYLLIYILCLIPYSNLTLAENTNLNEAIRNAQTAVEAIEGKAIAEYAVIAKKHGNTMKESFKNSASPGVGDSDLDSAINFLQIAIDKGNAGDIKSAREAAENAVNFLKRINKLE